MATDLLFGWDLTFKTVERDIKRKSDIIIAFTHWNMIKRGFRSIGIGDEVLTYSLVMDLLKIFFYCPAFVDIC